jgi:MoaA/NifB/PqqE/SkfB family radical SAM enzyme
MASDIRLNLRLKSKKNKVLFYLGSTTLLRFASLSPEWADIRVTEKCNSKCITCRIWKKTSEDELSTDEIKDALHQLRAVGVKNVVFVGGEPLLRNDIGEIVKEASHIGFESRILVTNGILLKEKAEEILRNGITNITVSMDGVNSANDEIRGVPNNFVRSIEGIKLAQKLKRDMNLNVTISIITTLLLHKNVEEIPKLIELARDLGVPWSFNLLDPHLDIFNGIDFSELLVDDKEKVDETIAYLIEVSKKYPKTVSSCTHMFEFARKYLKGEKKYDFHCVHGYLMIYLGSHGEVFLGCYAKEPVGNIRKNKLNEILEAKRTREIAKQMYMMDCPGCTNRYDINIIAKNLIQHYVYCERKKT